MKKKIVNALFITLFTFSACNSGIDINKEEESKEDWSNFQKPTVTLQIEAEGHKGITKYLELVKAQGYTGIEDWVQFCCVEIAKQLYYTPEEANEQGLKEITYKLNDGGALSYKGGSVPHIEIGFDLNYLVKFIDEHDMDAARDEIYGVLCHEITHGLQKEPKNAGGYNGGTECYGFIEGTADLSRLNTGGFNPERFPKEGGSYLDGYNTTAFFYLWIYKNFNTNFLKDLNRTAKEYETWSLTAATENLYGISVDELWQFYQQEIAGYPWDNASDIKPYFNVSSTRIMEDEMVEFTPFLGEDVNYSWSFEGGEPSTSTDKSAVVKFNKSGSYGITLEITKKGETKSATLTNFITVIDPNTAMDITEFDAKLFCEHNDSPSGEGLKNLIDNNLSSKFLTFNAASWIQIEMDEVYQIDKYSITSANDEPMRDPKKWILKGSTDGVNFTEIDNQQNVDFSDRGQKKEFVVNANVPYKYYRFELTNHGLDSYGSDILQFAEIELIGKKASAELASLAR